MITHFSTLLHRYIRYTVSKSRLQMVQGVYCDPKRRITVMLNLNIAAMKTIFKSLHSIILLIMLMGLVIPLTKAQSHFNTNGELQRPSTDSWNMIKYGEVGANLYTGTVQFNIPFYEYKDNDFTIPVNFRYSSNGCQPNIKAGMMGPGWTLDAGGVIAAEINGLPDDKGMENVKSYFELCKLSDGLPEASQLWRPVLTYRSVITIGCYPTALIYCTGGRPNTSAPNYEATPDFFHFNFLGYSGTFHFGLNGQIYIYNTNTPDKNFKITFNSLWHRYFLIETPDGYKYKFSANDRVEEYASESGDLKRRISWLLTQITAPNGRTVKFKYSSMFNYLCEPASYDLNGKFYDFVMDNSGNPTPPMETGQQREHHIIAKETENQYISSIEISNGPTINFSYKELNYNNRDGIGEGIDTTAIAHGRTDIRLKGISVVNPNKSVLKLCNIDYMNDNAGKRINYLKSIDISGEGIYSMEYHNWNNSSKPFPGHGTLSVDHWGYYNGKNNNNSTAIPFLKIVSTTGNEKVIRNYREADSQYAINGMLKKIIYPTGGYSVLEYEPHSYSKAFVRNYMNQFSGGFIDSTGTAGGLRIKEIKNYTANNAITNSKRYEYTKNGISTGNLLHIPRYHINYSANTSGGLEERNIDYYSSAITSYGSPHIEYSSVTEYNNDGSRTEYTFTNSLTSDKYEDYARASGVTAESTLLNGDWTISNSSIESITTPVTSRQAERGRLLERKVFKSLSTQSPEKSESYSYDTGRRLAKDNVPVYLIRKMGFTEVYVDNYRLTNKSTTEKRNGTSVTNGEKISYNAQGQITRQASHLGSGDSLITKTVYVYDLSSSERGQVGQTMLDSNVVSLPFREEQYIKRKGSSTETLAGGRRYTYICPVESNLRIIRPSREEVYDATAGTWKTEKTYTKYDKLGNLLEIKDNNGVYTTFLWGYQGLYPVAKVTGSTLAEVSTAINLSNIESNPIAGSMSFYENKLRTLSVAGKDVTTYYYLPFVGLLNINTPDGKVINYIYNTSGKLKRIEDNEGKSVEGGYYSPDNKLWMEATIP